MKLNNPFPDEVRSLYLGVWRCWLCSSNGTNRGGLEIHHILGRCSSVAFNSSCLCVYCHRHIGHSQQEHQYIFFQTMVFLRDVRYEPTEEDLQFFKEEAEELMSEELKTWLNKK